MSSLTMFKETNDRTNELKKKCVENENDNINNECSQQLGPIGGIAFRFVFFCLFVIFDRTIYHTQVLLFYFLIDFDRF